MDDEHFDLKVKYDTIFDNLFFSRKFRISMTEKIGYCPSGLTMDTRLNEKTSNIYFVACCKAYGYDFRSSDRVVGDYILSGSASDEMFEYMMEYLSNHLEPEIIEELNTYEGFVN